MLNSVECSDELALEETIDECDEEVMQNNEKPDSETEKSQMCWVLKLALQHLCTELNVINNYLFLQNIFNFGFFQ